MRLKRLVGLTAAATFLALVGMVRGCTTTTRPANAANREAAERTNRTDAANRESSSRYSAPKSGPGSLEGR